METSNPINVVQSGGASLIERSPVFSSDSKFLLCASGNDIKVYSTTSGECVHKLLGHTDKVTGITIHPQIKLRLVSASLDGTVRFWDYDDGVLLRTSVIGCPIYCIYANEKYSSHVYVIVKDADQYQLARISLQLLEPPTNNNDAPLQVEREVLLDHIIKPFSKTISFMSSGSHIACCREKGLSIVNIKHPQNQPMDYFAKDEGRITCLTCHPTDICCVTGHAGGKIKFWHNVCVAKSKGKSKSKEYKVISSTQHWHKDRVEDVQFSAEGSSVLSVGKEGVLVQWQYVESGNNRNFFPRLGAPMRHITVSPDGSLYATTHIDNSILIITNFFTIRQTLEGFTASRSPVLSSKQSKLPCGVVYDWKTETCVTNGKPGHLLFYNPFSDIQLYNLDIVHQNYVERDVASEARSTVLTHVAFSGNSNDSKRFMTNANTWMATIEERDDGVTSRKQKLKIWSYDESEQWWKLNTIVNDSHDASVTRLIFRPHSNADHLYPALLTTGMDGMAKIWAAVEENDHEDAPSSWSCEAVATYRQYVAHDGDFSQDGSLTALGFGNTLCVCSPDSLENLTVLLPLPGKRNIKRLLFGRDACQHILMISTDDYMYACNMLTGSLIWSASVQVAQLMRDPLSDIFAAITEDRNLHVFRPSDSLPIFNQSDILDHNIVAAGFVPIGHRGGNTWMQSDTEVDWMRKSRIFLISDRMSVHTLCSDIELEQLRESSKPHRAALTNLDTLKTPMASILARSNASAACKSKQDEIATTILPHKTTLDAVKMVTDTPCHVMPPISTLCETFLMSFLLNKSSNGTDEKSAVDGSEQENQEEEMDIQTEADISTTSSEYFNNLNETSFAWVAKAFKT